MSSATASSGIVQYVVVRSDLLRSMNWPIGAVLAQACHAVTAVTHLFYTDEYTQKYLSDLDNMHKIVLEVPNEAGLAKLQKKLEDASVAHIAWIEQPEDFRTCIAVKPYPKEQIQQHFKKLKLFKS